MQAEFQLDDKCTNLEGKTDNTLFDDESSKTCVQDGPLDCLPSDGQITPMQDAVFQDDVQEILAAKESSSATCVEEISRSDRNSGALTELATGSLATCTSILEVGKDDLQKQRSPNSVAVSKIRLCFAGEKHQKISSEAKKSSPRVPNGADATVEHKSHRDHQSLSSISKFVSQESKALSTKSSSCDSTKLTMHKLSVTREETSDFCKVYSQEYRLGVSKDGSRSPKSSAPRKSVIELKSKSLDPPPCCGLEGDLLHDETFHMFSASAAAAAVHPHRALQTPLHPSTMKRRESETAVFSKAENAWLRRISDSPVSGDGTTSRISSIDGQPFGASSAPKNVNIQKLRSFFGEATPRIMEAKFLTRHQSTSVTRDDSNIDTLKSDLAEERSAASCRCASTSGTFDPSGRTFEKMSRSRKSSKPLTRAHQDLSSRLNKKSLRDRDSSFSPKQYQKEHKTWKGKMVQTLRRYGSGTTPTDSTSSEEYAGALGVPLEHCVSSFANEFVPLIVETCTRIVEEKGLENIGVYRVPGNSVAVNALIEELNKDPDGLCLENEKWQDVNLVSSLLKLFFRKLPDSLITDDLYDAIIATNRIENAERRMLKMKKLMHELPEHNFETLRFLTQHLNRVAGREEINKMDAHNLAIVFGPTLVRPREDSMVVMVRDMTDQCKVIESIIVHCDWYFSSWDEDVHVPVDGEDEGLAPISGMNSELLAKAERLDKRSSLSF